MKKFLRKIDGLICSYIGIDHNEVVPFHLKLTENNLLIATTDSFKRHIHTQKLEKFLKGNLDELNNSNKQKVGLAMGKALAKNLIISFDQVKIT